MTRVRTSIVFNKGIFLRLVTGGLYEPREPLSGANTMLYTPRNGVHFSPRVAFVGRCQTGEPMWREGT